MTVIFSFINSNKRKFLFSTIIYYSLLSESFISVQKRNFENTKGHMTNIDANEPQKFHIYLYMPGAFLKFEEFS